MLDLQTVLERVGGMPLTIKELLKDRTPNRADVLIGKIKNEQPIALTSGLSVTLDKVKNANIIKTLSTKNEQAYGAAMVKGGRYLPVFIDKRGNSYSLNQFAKTADFGGGTGGISGGKIMEELSEVGVAVSLGMILALKRSIEPTDFTAQNMTTGSRLVEPIVTRQTIGSLLEIIAEDKSWAKSFVQVANILNDNLEMSNKRVHCKKSSLQNAIHAAFENANKNADPARPFASQDRWNPADVWAASTSIKLPPENGDFEELNTWVLENLNAKDAYGISLKKAGATAQLSVHNTDPHGQRLELLVRDLIVTSTNRLEDLFMAATSRMTYEAITPLSFYYAAMNEANEIEYRSRGSAILGTIRGKHAAQGSVGFGTINAVLRTMTGNNITDYKTIRQYLQEPKKKKEVVDEIIMMAETVLGQHVTPSIKKKLMATAKAKSDDHIVAKFQAVQLLYHVHNHRRRNKKKADQFLSKLFEYASSQTPLSSAFIKVA